MSLPLIPVSGRVVVSRGWTSLALAGISGAEGRISRVVVQLDGLGVGVVEQPAQSPEAGF